MALVCGVSASVGVNHLRKGQAQAKAEVVVVPVAAINIKRGDEVTEAKLVNREWPKAMVPTGVILKRADIVGNVAQVPIVKNEPIFSGKIGSSARFSGLVKEGMRAYTIATPSDSSLVAGLVEPGDKVDILFTGATNKATTGGASTVPLLQNIEVMAKGQITDATDNDGKKKRMRSVTLLVPLEMASLLALSQRMGALHLALRSNKDQVTADVSAVTLKQLLRTAYPAMFADESEPDEDAKATKKEIPESKGPSQFAVRTIRGTIRSTMLMRTSGMPIASAYAVQPEPFEPLVPVPPPALPDELPWFDGDEGSVQ
jgi:pilus assembly protein CpaB